MKVATRTVTTSGRVTQSQAIGDTRGPRLLLGFCDLPHKHARGDPHGNLCGSHLSEAGARVKENQLLSEVNTVVPVTDQRRIEVIANGLPFWGGKQLAIDTTVVSALTGQGVARGRWEGQAIHEAENTKRRKHHELVDGDRCHLFVMAFEVAGHWSHEAPHRRCRTIKVATRTVTTKPRTGC